MTTQSPNWLNQAFAHPIATFRLPNLEKLNNELETVILKSESGDNKNTVPSQKIQPEVFESRFDFLNWEIPAVSALKTLCLNRLGEVITTVNGYDSNIMQKLSVSCTSWFHTTRRGGYVQPHNHPNASWSLVYCVTCGEKDEGHEDSGSLIMSNPADSVNMYKDPANSNLKGNLSQNALKYTLMPSDMVIFPSYLSHWVSPYFGDGHRITVAANWWFRTVS
jgi:hypothetical protein